MRETCVTSIRHADSSEQAAQIFSELNMSADFAQRRATLENYCGNRVILPAHAAASKTQQSAAVSWACATAWLSLWATLETFGWRKMNVIPPWRVSKEARSIETELHQDDYATITEISIAQALIEKGNFAEAESSARKLAAWCSSKHDTDNEIFARDLLVRALLGQHRDADAGNAATELRRLMSPSVDVETRLAATTTIARVLARQKGSPSGQAELRAILSEAQQRSLVMRELEAKLAIAENEKESGRKSNPAELAKLASTAKSKGYFLIARKVSLLTVSGR